MSLPVRIAHFELGEKNIVYQGKFILAKSSKSLDVYGGPIDHHNHIQMLNLLRKEDVLGGARYTFAYGDLKLHDTSGGFGSIHNNLREAIRDGLVAHLESQGHKVDSASIHELKDVKKTDRNSSAWEALGYSVLN
jgi:hypothetical protein